MKSLIRDEGFDALNQRFLPIPECDDFVFVTGGARLLQPIDFPLNGVIAGWTEGLQLIGEGGEIELEIPSNLGYGARGAPPDIPGGATLHFKVELLKVM